MEQRLAGFCALCKSRCGAQYVVDDGRLVGVEAWPEHPTGAALCAKGRAAPELLYHPQRLTRPLRRTRPRDDPDPGWVEVGWDEALDDIAQRLDRIKHESGAEAVAFSSASPGATAMSDSLEWIERLIHAFGSPNFLTGVEICNWHRDYTHALTFGTGIGMPDYAEAELIVLWGFNPGNVWLAQAQAIGAARARGAKLVVIDPARTRHARDADLWLRVKPGTDAALALGLARCLIAGGLHDDDFVRRWSNAPFLMRDDTGAPLTEHDLDAGSLTDRPLAWSLASNAVLAIDTAQALADDIAPTLALRGAFDIHTAGGRVRCRPAFAHYADACEAFTPEHVEAVTGISAADVEAFARWLGELRRVSYFSWTGISQHVNATQADRAIALLFALTGSVDAPGGNLHLAHQPVRRVDDRSLLPEAQRARALGLAERPLGPPAFGWTLGRDFQDAVLSGRPYKVRALVGFGANLLMSQADTRRARETLQALEFQVHCDVFETPTGRHADYLLPVNTPWEREALRVGFEVDAAAEEWVQLRQKMVVQRPDNHARSDLDIVFALATRLGLGHHFFDGSIEAGWDHVLAPLGLTTEALRAAPEGVRIPIVQQLRKYAEPDAQGGVHGFATPSRRIELYSPSLARHGHAPVPNFDAPLPSVVLDEAETTKFPLTLGCAKSGYFCQSQHRALASLRRREPEPRARIHPALAAARDIVEGDWLIVRTRNGQARFCAQIDDAIEPTAVLASFGWWQACEDLGLAGGDPLADGHSHFNALISTERTDPVSGSIALRAFPCDIARDASVAGRAWAGWKRFDARVLSLTGTDVIELELSPHDRAPLPAYRAGQYVSIALDLGGRRLERSYSLIGAGGVDGAQSFRVAIRRNETEGMSARLHDALADRRIDGVEVSLQMPRGRFTLPLDRSTPVMLMAVGIGITPFLSMLETLAARPEGPGTRPITLLHGSRDGAHHAFAQRLETLARRLPCLSVVDVYSRPRAEDIAARPERVVGRVGAHLVPDAWVDAQARFYLCGPEPMLRSVTQALIARGVARHAIFQESFQAPAVDARAGGGSFEVVFRRSGRSLRWTAAAGSLLDLAGAHGIAMASGCRVGQCENCVLAIEHGTVAHLTEVELTAQDTCLACVAVPASDLVVDA